MHSCGVSTCQAIGRVFLCVSTSQPNIIDLLSTALFLKKCSTPVPAPSAELLVHTSDTFTWVCSPRGKAVVECPTVKAYDKVHTQVPAGHSLAVAVSEEQLL